MRCNDIDDGLRITPVYLESRRRSQLGGGFFCRDAITAGAIIYLMAVVELFAYRAAVFG
jgi:hypothetical protein